MATLPIYNETGEEVGKYEIDSEAVAARVSKQLLHDAVVMYQANLRQGSHNSRTRGEVSGTNKKMYRQKGTGNARAGGKRTNVRRGGGVARTVKPRDYSYRMPKKAIRLATRMAIRSKIDDGELVVIDSLGFDSPKTSRMASILKALGLGETTTLVATAGQDTAVYKSGRNITGVSVQAVRDLNALSVLTPRRMLVTKEALDQIKDGTFASSSNVSDGRRTGERVSDDTNPTSSASRRRCPARIASGALAPAGHRKGCSPRDPSQPIRFRDSSRRHQGGCEGGDRRTVRRQGRESQDANSQRQDSPGIA